MPETPRTAERLRIDPPAGSRPVSLGRTALAVLIAALPGPSAAAVVWPLMADRWKPIAAGVLAGTSLFSVALAAGAGWLVRREPPGEPGEPIGRPADPGPALDR
jgi:hypothetical protein